MLVPAFGLPALEVLVDVLDDDDGGIHQGADGHGDAPERHDVRGERLAGHRDEGEQDGERERQDGDQRGTEVQQERHDDQRHHDHLLDQGAFEGVDGASDEVGAVVGGDDLDPLGQGAPHLLVALPHPLDHLERVLAITHDHDPAHGLALAVQLREPAREEARLQKT